MLGGIRLSVIHAFCHEFLPRELRVGVPSLNSLHRLPAFKCHTQGPPQGALLREDGCEHSQQHIT